MQRRAHLLWMWIKDESWESRSILLLHPLASLTGVLTTFSFCPGLNHVQCVIIDFLCSSILIVDPSAEEESLSTAQLTVVTDEEDRLCAVHKPGQSKIMIIARLWRKSKAQPVTPILFSCKSRRDVAFWREAAGVYQQSDTAAKGDPETNCQSLT